MNSNEDKNELKKSLLISSKKRKLEEISGGATDIASSSKMKKTNGTDPVKLRDPKLNLIVTPYGNP